MGTGARIYGLSYKQPDSDKPPPSQSACHSLAMPREGRARTPRRVVTLHEGSPGRSKTSERLNMGLHGAPPRTPG